MGEREVTIAKPASVVSTYGKNVKMCIVDVRDNDFNNGGHIKEAINFPEYKFKGDNVKIFIDDCVKDGIDWVIFYCQYGQQRSVKAANAANRYINSLTDKPLIQISYLEGGFEAFTRKYQNTEYIVKE